jgi:PRTRC genetic system protein E
MEKEKFLRKFKGLEIYESETGVQIYEKGDLLHEIQFVVDAANKLNKGIEDAKVWITDYLIERKELAEKDKAEETPVAAEETPIRKCRVCGCTEADCSQCIEKTGKPCHWVEDDLCSACVPEKEIPVVDTRASQSAEEIIADPGGDSFFFQRLATMGNLDMTLRIMKVDGHLTMMITPGNGVKGMKPLNISGTPEEFDRDFINVIIPQAKSVPGLITNIEQVKQSAAPKEKAKPATTNKPAEKKPTSTGKPKQKPVKKSKTSVKLKLEKMKGKTIKEDKKLKPAETVKEEATPAVVEQSLF